MATIDRAFAESAEAEPSPELLLGLERRLQLEAQSRRPRISYAVLATAAAGLALVVGAWALHGRFAVRSQPAPITAAVRPAASAATAEHKDEAHAEPSAATSAARARVMTPFRARAEQRSAAAKDRRIFEAVKVQPEKAAVIRLYQLLHSGQIEPQSLLTLARTESEPMVIAPLRIRPLSIPPLEIGPDSNVPQSQGSEEGTNKETTP